MEKIKIAPEDIVNIKNVLKWEKKENLISKYVVAYNEVVRDSGYEIVPRYGFPRCEHYDNGLVGYLQMDYFNTEKDAIERLQILPKITNKRYINGVLFTPKQIEKSFDELENK